MTTLTLKQVTRNIATIKANGAKMDSLIHETALWCIEQVNLHGQVTPVIQLIGALGKSQRKEALITWVLDHSKLTQKQDKSFAYKHEKKLWLSLGVEGDNDSIMAKAKANPFYSYTRETKSTSPMFYFANRIGSIIETLQDDTKDVMIEKDKPMSRQERIDMVAKLKAIAGITDISSVGEALV